MLGQWTYLLGNETPAHQIESHETARYQLVETIVLLINQHPPRKQHLPLIEEHQYSLRLPVYKNKGLHLSLHLAGKKEL
ncbi:hypothetical protein D3C73_866700 [compost metagenome]